MLHAAISQNTRTAAPRVTAFSHAAAATLPQAPAHASWPVHARHALAGAGGFAAGVAAGALWLAPRVLLPGVLGAGAFVAQATTGFLWRHLARSADAPAATGAAADGWRGVQHALDGVIWGLMLPAAFGPALGVWLAVSLATAALAYMLDEPPARHVEPTGTWAFCGALTHALSDMLAAMWLQLASIHKQHNRPQDPAAQAVWRVELAHSQARARQAWQSLAGSEQDVWHQAGLDAVFGAPSWASAGRAGWSAACAFGAWCTGANALQAVGIGTSVGVALLLPRRAMAHLQYADVDAGAAAQAGHDLVYHVLLAGFGMSYYAR